METVKAVAPVYCQGATLEVTLIDGVGRQCVFQLRDLAEPPIELQLRRPADVPPLAAVLRDQDFLYFQHCPDETDEGRPVYRQIVRS